MRPLVEKALDTIKLRECNVPRVIINAPTGYGKTVSAPLIASELIKKGICSSFIHSLPFRAIVRDVYSCLLLNSFINYPKFKDKCRKGIEVLKIVREALEEVGIDVNEIAYQMGEHLSTETELNISLRKEPLFDARYIVTTLDSLILNMFRIPVTEIYSYRKHYTIPWSRIYVSALFLDEVHAIVEDFNIESRNKAFTAFKILLEIANSARIPTVVSSATIPNKLVEVICSSLGGDVLLVELGRSTEVSKHKVIVNDKDYENSVLSIKWRTEIIEESKVVEKVVEKVSSGRRVFVACDNIARAVRIYQELYKSLGENVELIHSLLTVEDKEKVFSKIDQVKVLVSTSIVEAGVDISFDDLITDGGNPFSVVQRVGRICRDLKCEEADIHIIKEYSSQEILKFVNEYGGKISWKLPYDVDGTYSYSRLLEGIVLEEDLRIKRLLETLLYPLLIPQYYIEDILMKSDGSLLREFLITVIVGEPEELSQIKYKELLKKSIIVDFEKIRKLILRNCIIGPYLILMKEFDFITDTKPIDSDLREFLSDSHPRRLLKWYVEILRRSYKDYRDVAITLVFLIDKRCYSNEGLII